jgi:small-conductance mechanosensitive channel
MAVALLRPLAEIALWLTIGVAYAHLIPGLRSIGTAMLAGASVASIVLGVAAQNTLGNLIAGLALLLYRPFQVGDRLQVLAPGGPEVGTVESVTLGYTTLRTFDNRRVVLPNSLVGAQTTVNLTSVDPRVMASVHVGISYTSDIPRARTIPLEIAESDPNVIEIVDCPLTELGSSSVTLRLRAWCHDQLAVHRFEYAVYEEAKNRFQDAGIEIPFPYQNVILASRG